MCSKEGRTFVSLMAVSFYFEIGLPCTKAAVASVGIFHAYAIDEGWGPPPLSGAVPFS